MKITRVLWQGLFTFLLSSQIKGAADVMKAVALPHSKGTVLGAAFSPDGSHLAVVTMVDGPGEAGQRSILNIVRPESGQDEADAKVLDSERPSLASSARLMEYSSEGRYLLLATKGSDVLLIIDAVSLKTLRRIVLHPRADVRKSLSQENRYFKGVVTVAASAKGDTFGVLTHDELQGNEIFLGSFSSGQIVKTWTVNRGRVATQLGQTSLSLNIDGSLIVISVLPDGNGIPKGFSNLLLYDTGSGDLVKSMRTDSLVGPVVLLPDSNILVSRIDTPSPFSRKACIEIWNFNSATRRGQFCDQGRNVSAALAVSLTSHRVVGFASQLHKSIEGQVYAASGRVDVWDLKSGSLIASSDELPKFVSYPQVSVSGEWVIAGGVLLRLSGAP